MVVRRCNGIHLMYACGMQLMQLLQLRCSWHAFDPSRLAGGGSDELPFWPHVAAWDKCCQLLPTRRDVRPSSLPSLGVVGLGVY